PDAPQRSELPQDEWTEGMSRIRDLTVTLARDLLDVFLDVRFVNDPNCRTFNATYGKRGDNMAVFEWNILTLGYTWFTREPDDERLLALILHEFGHHESTDHLSAEYHQALCRLGARLAKLVSDHPQF